MSKINLQTIGADPEVFISDGSGSIVSADGMIPGDKRSPERVILGAVQVDGMAAEFNIDPVSTKEEFIRNCCAVMEQLQGMLPDGHKLVTNRSDTWFSKPYFDSQPDRAKELGCDPDFSCYTGQELLKENIVSPDKGVLRTTAGHIHLGFTFDDGTTFDSSDDYFQRCCEVVKSLDNVYNNLALWDLDNERRTFYGVPGAFRVKPYGLEYRTPSSLWLQSPDRMSEMWDIIQQGVEFHNNSNQEVKLAS